MYDELRGTVGTRLAEVRRIALLARRLAEESEADARSLRGICFVLLYGTLEVTIRDGLRTLLRSISEAGVPYVRLNRRFHSIALDSAFRSLSAVTGDKKWAKRLELIERQSSTQTCTMQDNLLDDQVQSVRFATLKNLFEALGIGDLLLPEPQHRGILNDVFERRGDVAHGLFSAGEVGALKTIDEVDAFIIATSQIAEAVLDSFEGYFSGGGYLA